MNLNQRIEEIFDLDEEYLVERKRQDIKQLISEAIDYCVEEDEPSHEADGMPKLYSKGYLDALRYVQRHIMSKKQELLG